MLQAGVNQGQKSRREEESIAFDMYLIGAVLELQLRVAIVRDFRD